MHQVVKSLGRAMRSIAAPIESNTSEYKLLLYLPPFGRSSHDNFDQPNWTPHFGELGWKEVEGRK